MDRGAAGCVHRAFERLPSGPKCDAVDPGAVARLRAQPHVTVADLRNVDEPMRRQNKNRFGIAGAERTRTLQRGDQSRGRSRSRERRVDQEGPPAVIFRNFLTKRLLNENAEILKPLLLYCNPGRHCVTAAFEENSRRDGRADNAAEINSLN